MPLQMPLLHGLSAAQQQRVLQRSAERQLVAGADLFSQHSPAAAVFMLREGVIRVERNSAEGQRQVLAFLYPGSFIGFTNNDFYEYTVHTLTSVRVHAISRKALVDLGEDIPGLKRNLERAMNNVVLRLFDQLFALGQKNALERLAFFLRQLSERAVGADGRIHLPMSRQDIADHLGLNTETVSRCFSRLKSARVISVESAHWVRVLDPSALMRAAGSG